MERNLSLVLYIFKELWESMVQLPFKKVYTEDQEGKKIFGAPINQVNGQPPRILQFIFDNFYFNRKIFHENNNNTMITIFYRFKISKGVFGKIKLDEFFRNLNKAIKEKKVKKFREFNFIPQLN